VLLLILGLGVVVGAVEVGGASGSVGVLGAAAVVELGGVGGVAVAELVVPDRFSFIQSFDLVEIGIIKSTSKQDRVGWLVTYLFWSSWRRQTNKEGWNLQERRVLADGS
jgi:hypothetical protein